MNKLFDIGMLLTFPLLNNDVNCFFKQVKCFCDVDGKKIDKKFYIYEESRVSAYILYTVKLATNCNLGRGVVPTLQVYDSIGQ